MCSIPLTANQMKVNKNKNKPSEVSNFSFTHFFVHFCKTENFKMADAGETSGDRAKNFSVDEDRVLRENFAKHKDFLSSAQSNKVTNKMKNDVWKSIAYFSGRAFGENEPLNPGLSA